MKKCVLTILLVTVFCRYANADFSISLRENLPPATGDGVVVRTTDSAFEFGGGQQNTPNGPSQYGVPDLNPFINATTNEFEIVIDYYDGGLAQTITGSGAGRLGLGFNQIQLANGLGVSQNLVLSSTTIVTVPDGVLYGWNSSAELRAGTTDFGDFFNYPQSSELRTATIIARYRPDTAINLSIFDPTELNITGNWNVDDSVGTVQFAISPVPEPSSCALLALMGGLFGARSLVKRRRAIFDPQPLTR